MKRHWFKKAVAARWLLLLVACALPITVSGQSGRRADTPAGPAQPAKTAHSAAADFTKLSQAELLERASYGDLTEMKNLPRVCIVTDDYASSEAITKELAEEKRLEVVGQSERADFFLFFFGETKRRTKSVLGIYGKQVKTYEGTLYLVVKSTNWPGGVVRPRVLWHSQKAPASSARGIIAERRLAKDAARDLVGDIKKILGEAGSHLPPQPVSTAELHLSAIAKVKPVYSPEAKAAGAAGEVKLQLLISEEGKVTSATVISGHELLREAALQAAQQWVFKPLIIGGVPKKMEGILTFTFSLAP